MGRRVTWLIVGAVAALAVAAAVEALRGEPETRSRPAGEPGASAAIVGGEGLRGVLYYTDPTCVRRRRPSGRNAPSRSPRAKVRWGPPAPCGTQGARARRRRAMGASPPPSWGRRA